MHIDEVIDAGFLVFILILKPYSVISKETITEYVSFIVCVN